MATKISQLAKLLATLRNPVLLPGDGHPKAESPRRALALLYNLARGHALVAGRKKLADDDLPMIGWLTLSSMPASRRAVLVSLVCNSGEPVSAQDVVKTGNVSRHTAEVYMDEAHKIGLGRFQREGNGKASHLSVMPEWKDYVTGEMGRLLRRAATWQRSGVARVGADDDLDSLSSATDDAKL